MKKHPIIVLAVIVALVLIIGSHVRASGAVYLEKTKSDQGTLIRVANETSATLYCFVTYNQGDDYFDFYVNGNSYSRWHFEPRGCYEWSCQ